MMDDKCDVVFLRVQDEGIDAAGLLRVAMSESATGKGK